MVLSPNIEYREARILLYFGYPSQKHLSWTQNLRRMTKTLYIDNLHEVNIPKQKKGSTTLGQSAHHLSYDVLWL